MSLDPGGDMRVTVSILLGLFVTTPVAAWNPFNSDQVDDDLWTPGLVIGFESGQAVGIPLAVHLVNRRRGNIRTSLLVSLGLGVIGSVALWTGEADVLFEDPARQAVLIVIPVAQLVNSVLIERRTSRRKAR